MALYFCLILNAVVRVFFDEETYQVTENNGSVYVCVRRQGSAVESFSIIVATFESNPVQAQGIIIEQYTRKQ